jgi:hypothetical protein
MPGCGAGQSLVRDWITCQKLDLPAIAAW